MQDSFIRFLKDNNAFAEFKKEILPYSLRDLLWQMNDGGAEFLLSDGCIFFWRQATTGVDWRVLDEKWKEQLKDI